MSYAELIERALHGRSVNSLAKSLQIPQPTLRNYCMGTPLPNYTTAFLLAKEAGIDPRDMFMALVEEEAKKKGITAKIAEGFKKLVLLTKPRRDLLPAW